MKVDLTQEEMRLIRRIMFDSDREGTAALYTRFVDIMIAHPDADSADDGPEVAILSVYR